MSRRRMLFNENEKLPSGYTRCEYLENINRTEFLDTNIRNTGGLKIVVDVTISDEDFDKTDVWFFGEAELLTTKITCLGFGKTHGLYGAYNSRNFVLTHDFRGKYHVVFTESELICNGQTFPVTINNQFESKKTFYLFNLNSYNQMVRCKISHFSIFRNNEKVLDFIPTLDPNGKPCMYDTVTEKPFYNQGTGEFAYKIRSGGAVRSN